MRKAVVDHISPLPAGNQLSSQGALKRLGSRKEKGQLWLVYLHFLWDGSSISLVQRGVPVAMGSSLCLFLFHQRHSELSLQTCPDHHDAPKGSDTQGCSSSLNSWATKASEDICCPQKCIPAQRAFLPASRMWFLQPWGSVWFYHGLTSVFVFAFSTLQHCLASFLLHVH